MPFINRNANLAKNICRKKIDERVCKRKWIGWKMRLEKFVKAHKEFEKIMYDVPTDVDEICSRHRNIANNSTVNIEAYGLSLKVNKCLSTEKAQEKFLYSNVFLGKQLRSVFRNAFK